MGSATNGVHGFSAALLGSGGTASQTLKADPNAVGIFIMFAIIIGLIMAALIVAKNIASQSHPMMKSITQKALGVAGGATLGAVGSIGRNTLGRAGAILGDDDKLKERAAAGSISARLQLAAGRKASESSFDFRGLGIAKPLDAGKVGKNAQGGFKKVNEEAAKEEAKRAKSYMANKDIVDADKKEREAARDAAKEALDARTKEAIAAAKTAHPDAEKSQELLDAEEGEIRAQEGVRSTANDAQKQVWTDRLNKAKTQADTLRTEHAEKQQAIEASRKEFVERETAAATKTHSNAADRAKRTINDDRADAAVADAKGGNWKTKAAINTFGRIPGVNPFFNKLVNLTNEAKAAEIRKQTKKKSTKDEAVEAMKKLAKEDEEEEKKDKPPEEKAEGEKGEEKKDA